METQYRIPTHRCKVCGCKWILWPAGTMNQPEAWWSLGTNEKPGPCCDNMAMGDQIEPLPDCTDKADPRLHDFQGWVEFDDGRGGTTVCTRCGISAFSHSMRYGP